MTKAEFIRQIEMGMPEDADVQVWSIQYESEKGNQMIGMSASVVDGMVFMSITLAKLAKMLNATPTELAKVALAMDNFRTNRSTEDDDDDDQ